MKSRDNLMRSISIILPFWARGLVFFSLNHCNMRCFLRLGRGFFVLMILLLALLLAVNALSYANFDTHYGFLKLKQQAIVSGWYLPAYYSHVLISGIILVAGFFQLFPSSSGK